VQYHIRVDDPSAAVERLAEAVTWVDPAAIADCAGALVRISTCLSHAELHALCGDAGIALGDGDLEQLPSECCGGCGG
jgi:hypothetical protein